LTIPVGAIIVTTRAQRLKRPRTYGANGFYLAPAWLLLLGVIFIPFILSIWTSTQDASLIRSDSNFVGLDNYIDVLTKPDFWEAILTTVVISVLSLIIQLPLGFLIAVLVHNELKGTSVFRSALLLPMLLTPVAVGLMWRLMMNVDTGVIAGILRALGLAPIDWLGDKTFAVFSIVIVDSWQNIPFVMLLMLAGLQAMSQSPIEAARVDGASTIQIYRHVILPLIAPVALVVVMIRVIESIKLFDIIYILTNGGPGTATQNLSLLDFRSGFTYMQTSTAAALGVLIILVLSPIYFLWRKANK
jgi:multiple sugar transport system permease protein